jgi:hypothetical protein
MQCFVEFIEDVGSIGHEMPIGAELAIRTCAGLCSIACARKVMACPNSAVRWQVFSDPAPATGVGLSRLRAGPPRSGRQASSRQRKGGQDVKNGLARAGGIELRNPAFHDFCLGFWGQVSDRAPND